MRTFNELIIVLGTFFAIIVAIMIPISLIFWQPVNKVTTSAFLIFSNTIILYLISRSTEDFDNIDKTNTVYLTVLYTVNILDIILLICT